MNTRKIFLAVLYTAIASGWLCSAESVSAAEPGIGEPANAFYDNYNGEPWRVQQNTFTTGRRPEVIKGMPAGNTGDFSIKITNLDYADSFVYKSFPVKKNTEYRVSATVKYADYAEKPDDAYFGQPGGANIDVYGKTVYSEKHSGTEWKRIVTVFNSGNSETAQIRLENGNNFHACKGSAWFSDIRIEEKDMTPSTAWNMLALVYKDIDASLIIEGRTVKIHNKMDSAFEQFINGLLKKLPNLFYEASGGLMSISTMDIVMIDTPITNIKNGAFVAPEDIVSDLDKHTKGKTYNQIIAVASNATPDSPYGWGGMGAMRYKDMWFVETSFNQSVTYGDNSMFLFLHEILHCLERKANLEIRPVANLHDSAVYGLSGGELEMKWYSDYMQNRLPDKKGLPPEVYTVYNGAYRPYADITFKNTQTSAADATAGKPITILLKGELLQSDAAPFIAGDRVMVPIRVIAEALGAKVDWDDASQTDTITRGEKTLSLTIGKPLPGNMGTPIITNDRVYVPVRYLAEAFGANVIWNSVDRTVSISI